METIVSIPLEKFLEDLDAYARMRQDYVSFKNVSTAPRTPLTPDTPSPQAPSSTQE